MNWVAGWVVGWVVWLLTFPGRIMRVVSYRILCDINKVEVLEVDYFRGRIAPGEIPSLGTALFIAVAPLLCKYASLRRAHLLRWIANGYWRSEHAAGACFSFLVSLVRFLLCCPRHYVCFKSGCQPQYALIDVHLSRARKTLRFNFLRSGALPDKDLVRGNPRKGVFSVFIGRKHRIEQVKNTAGASYQGQSLC